MQQSERNWEQEAQEIIGYFEPLSKEVEMEYTQREWHLGLFMAHQWLRFVQLPSPDKAEVSLFCKALESQKMNMGSGWHDLIIRVKWWAKTELKVHD